MKLDTLRSGPAIVLGLSVFALADLVGAQDAGAPWPNGDQQVRGMCYQPLPEGSWTSTGAAGAEYAQSDVNVDQWSALWGKGGDGVTITGTARDDVGKMSDANVNVIRMYDYFPGSTAGNLACSGAGPVPPLGGRGHINFLDYCDQNGIQVIIPISNYIMTSFPKDNYGNTWQDLVDAVIDSVKVNDALHPAVHSFSIGNELDYTANCSCDSGILGHPQCPAGATGALPCCFGTPNTSADSKCIQRAVDVANRIHLAVPDVYVTIPLSQAPGWQEAMNIILNGGTGTFQDGQVTATVANPITDKSRFYNSIQAFQTAGNYQPIIEQYQTAFPNEDDPKLLFTEWGWAQDCSGCGVQAPDDCTGKATSDTDQAEKVYGAAQSVQNYLAANPDTKCKGYCILQWKNQVKHSGCDHTFGLHKPTGGDIGTATFNTYNCGGGCWVCDTTYQIDELREIKLQNNVPIFTALNELWSQTLSGDLNNDGVVDSDDLIMLRDSLGYRQHDSDFDKDIDGKDLGSLLGSWGSYGGTQP